ncbi:MAG: hypothetical protein BWY14_00610 [Parcubacteria group bacterium ADurb.Bin192]|nr:MAG: hypothetical protein BWY14_00610 [Parcubacteria group bacterium ADurb.Bin192]
MLAYIKSWMDIVAPSSTRKRPPPTSSEAFMDTIALQEGCLSIKVKAPTSLVRLAGTQSLSALYSNSIFLVLASMTTAAAKSVSLKLKAVDDVWYGMDWAKDGRANSKQKAIRRKLKRRVAGI